MAQDNEAHLDGIIERLDAVEDYLSTITRLLTKLAERIDETADQAGAAVDVLMEIERNTSTRTRR